MILGEKNTYIIGEYYDDYVTPHIPQKQDIPHYIAVQKQHISLLIMQ